MTQFLIGGLVVLGVAVTTGSLVAYIAYRFFQLGWEKGRDDLYLDPGDTVGQLPTVGETSGRHAMPDWPTAEATVEVEPVARPAQFSWLPRAVAHG